MNNFSVLECPVYFDKTNMLDMLSLSAGRAILCQNRLGEQIIADNSWGLDPMKGHDTLRQSGIPRRNTRL